MRLLLDTHIWVWSALDRDRLSRRVAAVLEDPTHGLWLSPISLWEVLTLCRKNRLNLRPNPLTWIHNALNLVPVREASLTFEIANETMRVHLPHRDPADRFLVATASVLDLTLVTADEVLLQCKQIASLSNH